MSGIQQMVVASSFAKTIIGGAMFVFSGGGVQNYPASTVSGDLVVLIITANPGQTPAAPSGFTKLFTEAPNYEFAVYTKVSAGESSVTVPAYSVDSLFTNTILSLRGVTAVSTTRDSGTVSGGATDTLSVAVTGIGALMAIDRGAASYPTVDSGQLDLTGTSGAFYSRTNVYLAYTTGAGKSYTDVNDSFGTDGLLICAT